MTQETQLYLRDDVCIDPLVNQWYAWPNLIAPVTYAMYMRKTHRRLMNSFVNNHELLIIANKDQAMDCVGEFVDCVDDEVEALRAFFGKFDSEHAQ